MITECPKCKKRYKITDSVIPIGGGPVRCPNCSNIFTVYREPLNIKLIPIEEEKLAEPISEKVSAKPTMVREEKKIGVEIGAPPSIRDAKEVLMSFQEKGVEVVKKPAFPDFWSEDKKEKHIKAKRLARSLAKDILLYHKDEVKRGRINGNLVELLKDEIKRSWKFYKNQIGTDVITEKNYFKEALNEIIADGEEIFV